MPDKDNKKELSDKDLEKATGGTGDIRPPRGHATMPGRPKVTIDDPENKNLGRPPRALPDEEVRPL